ncbi:protein kinase domain-containing protein [Streptosporangium vulgare]|uniref:non-specific serine/threonine protein kinase n=1 Tax=Streptosporangium vulgare TaxID=46190 RepID=A0ABV5T7C7_9ACTN
MAERKVAGRYRLLEHIGEGGMGIVWRAHDELLDRVVAVKEVRHRGVDEAARTDLNRRTIREARTAGRLDHPSVVIVHDVVEEDGRPWIVMQLVRSRSLGEIVRSGGPLPPERVASVGLHVLGALRAAHAAGVLHRDVKPENVLLADDGRVVLTDFGIASMTQETGITRTGAMVGTPAFLPPERLHGLPATAESDLWSLGATLYAALEGRPPFERATAAATMMAVLHGEPSPMSHSGPLSVVILGLLARDPAARMVPDQAEALLGRASSPSSPGPVAGRAPHPGPVPERAPHPGPVPGQAYASPGFPADPPRADPPPRQDVGRGAWQPGYGDSPSGPGRPSHPATPAPAHPGQSPYEAGHTRPEQSRLPASHTRPEQPPYTQPEQYAHPQSYARPEPYAHHEQPRYASSQSYAQPEQSPYAHHEQRSPYTHPGQRAYGSEPSSPPGSWPGREQPTDTGGAPPPRRARTGRLALLAGVPVLVVAVGVGGWLLARNLGDTANTGDDQAEATLPVTDPTSTTPPETTPTPEPTPTVTPRPSRTVPAGWRLHRDPMGFSVAVPGNWRVKRFAGRDRVEFRAPGASGFLWIESTDDPEKNPVRHWQKVEKAGTADNVWPGYRRIGITSLVYRGVPAADWEFTYLRNGVRTRVLDRGFRTVADKPYAIYWESPASGWDRSFFDTFTRTFRP